MQRRSFILAGLATLCAAAPALAAGYEDQIVSQLKGQGFRTIRVGRTLLGRVRIVANGNGGQREIILNPRTGEILRDLWMADNAGAGSSGGGLVDNRGRGRGGDDDRDDDDDDRDDDDDHSGSGSGGSGNSGSGGGDDDDDDGDDD